MESKPNKLNQLLAQAMQEAEESSRSELLEAFVQHIPKLLLIWRRHMGEGETRLRYDLGRIINYYKVK